MIFLKKISYILLIFFIVSCADSNSSKSITIGTNPAGTFYYVVGTGLSKLFSEKLDRRAIAQPASGSAVYVPLINNGEMSLGFSTSIEAGSYYQGKMNLQEQPNLRVLMRFWAMPYGYMVRGDSDLHFVSDLKGKSVVDKQSANITLSIGNSSMMRVSGLSSDDYKSITVGGLPQGITAVTDGLADAAPIALGQGNVRKANATTPGGIRFLDMSNIDNVQQYFDKSGQGFNSYTVSKEDQLPGAVEGLLTGSVDIYLVASSAMPDEEAMSIVKVIEDNWDMLQTQFAALKRGHPSQFVGNNHTVPFHPGAIKYYLEKNRWDNDSEVQNQSLLSQY